MQYYDDSLLTKRDVANYLRYDSTTTIDKKIRQNKFPRADRYLGNRPRWYFKTIKHHGSGGINGGK